MKHSWKLMAALLTFVLLGGNSWTMAHDLEVDGIYYNKTGNGTVSATYGPSLYNTYKEAIVIPETVTSDGVTYTVTAVGDKAFQLCVRLTSVELPATITSIGDEGFTRCPQLTHITLPEAVTSIGDSAFYACMRLEEIVVPDAVTSIGREAFFNCGELAKVVLGSGLQTIGSMAFSCTTISAINSITCRAIVPPVMAAEDCFFAPVYSDATLYVPAASLSAYQEASWWNLFLNIEAASSDVQVGDVNGDGDVDISDVTDLIDMLLTGETEGNPAADVNGDNEVDIADVTALIDILLTR